MEVSIVSVTVEFLSKIVHKEFKSRCDAVYFLTHLRGNHIFGCLDDGTFAVYIG